MDSFVNKRSQSFIATSHLVESTSSNRSRAIVASSRGIKSQQDSVNSAMFVVSQQAHSITAIASPMETVLHAPPMLGNQTANSLSSYSSPCHNRSGTKSEHASTCVSAGPLRKRICSKSQQVSVVSAMSHSAQQALTTSKSSISTSATRTLAPRLQTDSSSRTAILPRTETPAHVMPLDDNHSENAHRCHSPLSRKRFRTKSHPVFKCVSVTRARADDPCVCLDVSSVRLALVVLHASETMCLAIGEDVLALGAGSLLHSIDYRW